MALATQTGRLTRKDRPSVVVELGNRCKGRRTVEYYFLEVYLGRRRESGFVVEHRRVELKTVVYRRMGRRRGVLVVVHCRMGRRSTAETVVVVGRNRNRRGCEDNRTFFL